MGRPAGTNDESPAAVGSEPRATGPAVHVAPAAALLHRTAGNASVARALRGGGGAHARALVSGPGLLTPALARDLQSTAGNAAVAALVARQQAAPAPRAVPLDRVRLQRVPHDPHLDRNRFNVLPTGALTPIGNASPNFVYQDGGDNTYRDAAGLVWQLEPNWKTKYHQPPGHENSPNPYPNKKFLCPDAGGGSFEAIRQPDGTYLTTGPLQGTYNYVHPSGVGGSIGHFFHDIAPHYRSDQYRQHPPLDPRVIDVNTYRQRWERQILPIGERHRTNRTDPVDRTVVMETGVVWVQHASGEVLVLARATNGRLTFMTFIDAELRAQAIAYGQSLQPRGIQHIPDGPPYIFDVPAAVPSNAARP